MKKTVAFYTFGCRLNQAETARFRKWYLNQGWQEADWREAERVIVNTCAVTGKAEREVRSFLRRVRRENPKAEIWAMGCYVSKLKIKNEKLKNIIQIPPSWLQKNGNVLRPAAEPPSHSRLATPPVVDSTGGDHARQTAPWFSFAQDERGEVRADFQLRLVSNEEKRRMLREMGE